MIGILLAAMALLLGGLVGWLARGGAVARADAGRAAADAARAAAEERAEAARSAGEAQTARTDGLARALETTRTEREAARIEAESLRGQSAVREEEFARRILELREAKEALSQQFGDVGAKLLAEAQAAFLTRADERFRQSEERSGLELKALLQPVRERLQKYEEGVGRIEKERQEAYGSLTGLIGEMRVGQEAVRAEAAKLVNTFRSAPKARGRWGEQQLKNVLETCGLSEHCDFRTEVSVAHEEGRLRPDVIVKVPGGRALVIDAKVSLNAYQDAFAGVDEGERLRGLAAHATAMRAHVNSLGNKAYWAQFDDTPDYVIMFVPGEHFLSAALEHDPALWDFAFEKRVLLATPTNLIAIARTVAAVWRQEKLAAEAKAIGALGKEMHDRIAVATEHLRKVGSGLGSAVNNYNAFVSSFERNVTSTGRKFRDLNIETGAKEIGDLPAVEALPRHADHDGGGDGGGGPGGGGGGLGGGGARDARDALAGTLAMLPEAAE